MSEELEIELVEFKPKVLDTNALTDDLGEYIWRKYPKQIKVEFPSPITNKKWKLTSLGWVGRIRLNSDVSLLLKPKVSVKNLFRMWEYAYSLKSFSILNGLVKCDSVDGFYNILTNILANKILHRSSRGFYKDYKQKCEILPFVRGKIEIKHSLDNFHNLNFHCNFDENTTDIKENQILLWTTYVILKSGLCSRKNIQNVKRAFNILQSFCTLNPVQASECINRKYNRLNNDYEEMHGICRFFLEQIGPSYTLGEYDMIPFLVDMAKLFELFVASWLKNNLPDSLDVKAQEKVYIGNDGDRIKNIDLVIYSKSSGEVIYVLDTKYKNYESPSQADINQIVTYALTKNCNKAILLYPIELNNSFKWDIKNIKVRTLTFSLDGDLEEQGRIFLEKLLNL